MQGYEKSPSFHDSKDAPLSLSLSEMTWQTRPEEPDMTAATAVCYIVMIKKQL